MPQKAKNRPANIKEGDSRNALVLGILAGLAAPSIFCTPPSYGNNIHRNGLNADFKNVGIYMRSALGRYKMAVKNEKTQKS